VSLLCRGVLLPGGGLPGLYGFVADSGGDLLMQSSLFAFEPGRSPSRGYPDAEDHDEDEILGGFIPGGRCSKCGHPLRGGGLKVMGWPGLLCWDCYHSNLGRRDGRNDLSSDASGERNTGYNWRR